MALSAPKKLDKAAFDALSSNVYDRLHELTSFSKEDFDRNYRTGMIEQWRGRNAAKTSEKSEFIQAVLTLMVESRHIASWEKIGSKGRSDYKIGLISGRIAVLEAKGSMDGNSATILERPMYADELVIWTITTNPMSDVVANVWSGIHTRISPEHIINGKRVDVIMAWDHLGSSTALCPDLADLPEVEVNGTLLPPPCLYLLPHELPILGFRNPVKARGIGETEFAKAVCDCFGVPTRMVGTVDFELGLVGNQLGRRTSISFGNKHSRMSKMTLLRRDLSGYMNAVAMEKQTPP